ncbi:MAG: hypothetical protein K6B54_00440 [Clostridia bacterium]|nr:hypothetical protein [Clostridia bacterium]
MLDDVVIKDALHYLGAKEGDKDAEALLRKVLNDCRGAFCPRQITAFFPVDKTFPAVTFSGCEIVLEGESIRRHFSGATEGLFSAFTLGISFDKKVRELSFVRPAESVALNAIGSAYAERKADEMLKEVCLKKEAEGFKTNFRFCPGYGDLPLGVNAMIAAALNAGNRIGLTVTDGGLLLPIKSIVGVTACLPVKE